MQTHIINIKIYLEKNHLWSQITILTIYIKIWIKIMFKIEGKNLLYKFTFSKSVSDGIKHILINFKTSFKSLKIFYIINLKINVSVQ